MRKGDRADRRGLLPLPSHHTCDLQFGRAAGRLAASATTEAPCWTRIHPRPLAAGWQQRADVATSIAKANTKRPRSILYTRTESDLHNLGLAIIRFSRVCNGTVSTGKTDNRIPKRADLHLHRSHNSTTIVPSLPFFPRPPVLFSRVNSSPP